MEFVSMLFFLVFALLSQFSIWVFLPSALLSQITIPDALAFPILCLSHRIRYLLLQTTDLPNTIDLLHQTTDDGIASTIPTIASDISFRSASILPQTRNGAPFAVGLIQPSTAPFAMGWVGCILVGNTTDPAHRVRPKGIFLF